MVWMYVFCLMKYGELCCLPVRSYDDDVGAMFLEIVLCDNNFVFESENGSDDDEERCFGLEM